MRTVKNGARGKPVHVLWAIAKKFSFCNFTINIRPFGQLDCNIYVKYIEEGAGQPPRAIEMFEFIGRPGFPFFVDGVPRPTVDWAIVVFFC